MRLISSASMGPSPLSDGMVLAGYDTEHGALGFNGAVASQRRNGWLSRLRRFSSTGFNGAVASQRRNGRMLCIRALLWRASMGPSPLSDGMLRSVRDKNLDDARLQWGRRLSATECVALGYSHSHVARLQWGRRLSATECRSARTYTQLDAWLQWGRRLSATECRPRRRRPRQLSPRFNGAVASQRRNGRFAPPTSCPCLGFNGAVASQRRNAPL